MRKFFKIVGSVLTTTRNVVLNLGFLLVVIVLLTSLFSEEKAGVPDQAALVLNIAGDLVEQKRIVNPFQAARDEMSGSEQPPEVLVTDVVDAIENAKHDQRIKALVLELREMNPAGLNKLRTIATAIESFKESNKPVFAIGDYYLQHQYYLASYADQVLMNPNGTVALEGYGRYRVYMKSFLEKIKVTPHVFKVGTYKSAIEPFIRDDMSDAAKEANTAWLNELWHQYREDVALQRDLSLEELDISLSKVRQMLTEAGGDMAQMSLNAGLVDKLVTREEMRDIIAEVVGRDDEHHSFNQIWLDPYLAIASHHAHGHDSGKDKVGIVVAKGTILDGDQPAGTIGGDSTAWLLRQARYDDDVKAVVLRIDSPGGSAFASDLIREEIDELKKAGKPVIASMSTYAASGGYWIAAPADQIWASPSTITGSIGIFGLITTVDKTLASIGMYTDGVATTDLAGMSPTRPLDPAMGAIIQQAIDHGYQQFISLVARERDMTPEQVDKIAQGRVWLGTQALELGLVDALGSEQDAIAAAAELAGLSEYDTKDIVKPLSFRQQLLMELFGSAMADLEPQGYQPNPLKQGLSQVLGQLGWLMELNDPQGIYAHCMACELN